MRVPRDRPHSAAAAAGRLEARVCTTQVPWSNVRWLLLSFIQKLRFIVAMVPPDTPAWGEHARLTTMQLMPSHAPLHVSWTNAVVDRDMC